MLIRRKLHPPCVCLAPRTQAAHALFQCSRWDSGRAQDAAIEATVWKSVEDIVTESPAIRAHVKEGRALVVGAVYDIATGKVMRLDEGKPAEILAAVEADEDVIMGVYAE